MALQALNGFRDFYPQECEIRDYVFKIWRETSHAFGFQPYDGPPLEPLDLYLKKNEKDGEESGSGAEIVSQLYDFKDKGERHVTLRPEMTPTLARMVGARHRDFRKPIKWYSSAQFFRYERPQKGRLREFFQWNADIFGEAGPGAEAELISLLATALKKFGLGKNDIVIRVSDRQFWSDFLKPHNLSPEDQAKFYQALDKIERNDEAETRKLLGPLADSVFELFAKNATSPRLDALMERLAGLGLGDCSKVDLKIVRGLAYYTGYVFEVHDAHGKYRALAGGGRYDHLVQKLCGGQPIPAVGFGMGDVVLTELLKDRGLLPDLKSKVDFFIVIAEETMRKEALGLVSQLRSQGRAVDYALEPAKFGKQLELANERNARYVLIFGQAAKESKLEIKDMSTGEQKAIAFTLNEGAFSFAEPLPSPV